MDCLTPFSHLKQRMCFPFHDLATIFLHLTFHFCERSPFCLSRPQSWNFLCTEEMCNAKQGNHLIWCTNPAIDGKKNKISPVGRGRQETGKGVQYWTEHSMFTVTRTLWRMGYHYLQARKKVILTEKDKTARRRFPWDIKKNYSSDLWTKHICFYLDGASFAHKYNPCDQSRAPKGRVWRQTREGLDNGCTAKGTHVGTGGRALKLFIAISFRQGVTCCEEYERLDGEFFKSFVTEHFP